MQRIAFALFPLFVACASSAPREPSSSNAPYNRHFDEICTSGFSPVLKGEQVKVLGQEMAGRDHRLWHHFWHATRNSWHTLTKEQRDFFTKLDPRWVPVRLLGAPPGAAASDKYNPRKNSAGEDFLYMHHQMMTELYSAFGSARLPCPEPWLTLPPPGDKIWPVEKSHDGRDEKSEAAYTQMESWRKQFQDSRYLKTKSLGEVGYLLETSLHNNMHMRWGTYNPPRGFGDRPDITPATLAKGLEAYDAPGYNWLYDSYSAHVNPTFWKLHGLVENVLFSWLEANGYDEADENCEGKAHCYVWKGTWVGASPHVVRGPAPGGPDGHGGHEDFADQLKKAYDDFIEGRDADSDSPHGPVRAVPPDPTERARRRKVLDDAFHILQKHSHMSRGRLSGARMEKVLRRGSVTPEEYVRWVEQDGDE